MFRGMYGYGSNSQVFKTNIINNTDLQDNTLLDSIMGNLLLLSEDNNNDLLKDF